jgi:hypothetical protein
MGLLTFAVVFVGSLALADKVGMAFAGVSSGAGTEVETPPVMAVDTEKKEVGNES